MPICATGSCRRAIWTAVFATAAVSCGENHPSAQAVPEGMHLIPNAGASALQVQVPATPVKPFATAGMDAQAGSAAMVGAGAGASAGTNAEAAGSSGSPARLPVRDANRYGNGVCSSTSVDQFIAKAQELRPELRDIQNLIHVDGTPGTSSISAYFEPDGTFSLVFRRGDGDCLAGCINNEYWYIRADDSCAPQQVGYYKRANNSSGNCYNESGMALWNEPRALDPVYACGANLMPQNISGSHELHARGVLQACARSGESIASMSIDKMITLEITQDAATPAHATLTVHGVGHPLIDDRKLSAEVVRRHVTVHAEDSNLPSNCPKQSQLDLEYDFEGLAQRRLYLMQVDTPDCSKPDDYCKGYVELSLSEP